MMIAATVGGEAQAQDGARAQDAAPHAVVIEAWRPRNDLGPRIPYPYVYDPDSAEPDRPKNGFMVTDGHGRSLTHEQVARRMGDPRADDIEAHTRRSRTWTALSFTLIGGAAATSLSAMLLDSVGPVPGAAGALGLTIGGLTTLSVGVGQLNQARQARFTVDEVSALVAAEPDQ